MILAHDGKVHYQEGNGDLKSFILASHKAILHVGKPDTDVLRQSVHEYLALGRLDAAWRTISELKHGEVGEKEAKRNLILSLAKKALELMDIGMAIRAYRQLRDVAMVMALQELQYVEDYLLLAGHIYMLQGEYDTASNRFLASSQPRMALEMRRHLLVRREFSAPCSPASLVRCV